MSLLFLLLLAQDLPKNAQQARAIPKELREGQLKTGQMAPDFDLRMQKSEQRVRLSSWRGKKAVALVFGSYT
jgi:hypothetical protein